MKTPSSASSDRRKTTRFPELFERKLVWRKKNKNVIGIPDKSRESHREISPFCAAFGVWRFANLGRGKTVDSACCENYPSLWKYSGSRVTTGKGIFASDIFHEKSPRFDFLFASFIRIIRQSITNKQTQQPTAEIKSFKDQ